MPDKKENAGEINFTRLSEEITSEERKRILESLNRTDTEKFFLFTRLMRIHFTLKKAVIIFRD